MKRLYLILIYLLLYIGMRAATVEVRTNLWSGNQVMDATWSNWISLPASDFASAEVGNELSVNVSAISASYGLIMLNTGKWTTMPSAENGKNITDVPCEVKWSITEEMLAELKANGLIVKGVSYTATSVDLIRQVETSDTEKGNPVSTIWTGSKTIDWSSSTGNGWLSISKNLFAKAKVGNKLRFNYDHLAIGAQGHICTGSWKDMPDGTDYKQLTSTYFEYDITTDMLAQLQEGGCIVMGVGYVLTSVDIIDPTQVPTIVCQVRKSDIKCWEKGESPVIGVSLQSLESKNQTITVTVALRTDAYVDYKTYEKTVTLSSGETQTALVEIPDLTPGFYHAVVKANYSELSDFNIGYDPTSIVSAPDAQADFLEFWDKAKAELASIAPEYKLTKIDAKSTSKRNVYLVEMKSISDESNGTPVTIRGYYAEPVEAGTYPVIITQNGYDGDASVSALNFCPNGDANPGWIELNLSVRGQVINNRGDNQNKYGDWFAYNFGDKDSYYYRGAYIDVVRGIDFIATREKAQQGNIFMMGGSQGGALTIAGAALDHRIKAIAPSIQFMSDFPDYFKVGAWPASVAKQQQTAKGLSDEEMYTFLSYFDTKNLAPYITCPVKTAMGLQDPVCPPHTNFAPYNNLNVADKQYVVNGNCQHETPATWYNECINFFKEHITDDVILSESAPYTPQTANDVTVKVLREVKKDQISDLCLPFTLSAEQITEGFGAKAKVYECTKVSDKTLYFAPVTTIEAGKAYLVRCTEDKAYLQFSNVTIAKEASVRPTELTNESGNSYVFTGTFSPYTLLTDGTEVYLDANGLPHSPSTDTKDMGSVPSFHTYLKVPAAVSDQVLISIDGVLSSIRNLNIATEQPTRVYNMMGMYIGNSLKGLTKGIYIVNSRTQVVR